MQIIRASAELTPVDKYNLTTAPDAHKMSDCKGQTIEFDRFCIYEDVNSKGELQKLLAVQTPEGEVLATNSPTFIEDFEKMWDMFQADGVTVKALSVKSGISKAGREFITCRYAA